MHVKNYLTVKEQQSKTENKTKSKLTQQYQEQLKQSAYNNGEKPGITFQTAE